MLRLSPFALALLFSLLATLAWPVDNIRPQPSEERINQRLEQLDKRQDPDAEHLKETYRDSLLLLQSAVEHQQEAALYTALMEDYPGRIAALEQKLSKGESRSKSQDLGRLPMAELQQQLSLRNAQRVELQSDLDALTRELEAIDGRQLSLPQQLSDLKAELEATQRDISTLTSHGEQGEAQRTLAISRQSALGAEIKALELEQLSAGNRRKLAQAEQQLLKQRIEQIGIGTKGLRQAIAERRRQETERTIAEASRQSDDTVSLPPLVGQVAADNQRLSGKLKNITDSITAANQERSALADSLRSTEALQKSIRTQLNQPLLNSAAGAGLRSQLASLPQPMSPRRLHRKLSEAQLEIYALEQNAAALISIDEFVLHLENQTGINISAELKQQLTPYADAQRDLIDSLLTYYTTYVGELAQLEQATGRYNNLISTTREQISEQLLWLPNTLPVNRQWLAQVSRNLGWLSSRFSFTTLVDAAGEHPQRTTLTALLIIVAVIVQLVGRQRLPHLNRTSAEMIGKVTRDHFFSTLYLIGAITLYALPVATILFSVGKLLANTDQIGLAAGLGRGLLWSAGLIFTYRWIYLASAPEGLFQQHFSWRNFDFRTLRFYLRTLSWTAMPLLLLLGIGEHPATPHLHNGIGRIAFVMLCGLAGYGYLRILGCIRWTQLNERLRHPNTIRRAARVLLTVLPATFAVLAIYGYYFTGMTLLAALHGTLLVLFAVVLLYGIGLRWLLIEERRLAFNRAKARRAEQQAQRNKEGGDEEPPTEPIDENLVDLQTVSDHAKVLLRTVMLIGLALSIGFIWSDLFRSLSFLDQITIWQTATPRGSADAIDQITLKEIVFAAAVMLLMMIAVRNLPGVMEILVLQHLTLSPGTGYAVTTLLKYVLVATGILYSFSLLGFEWAKLQWLVAALGVGLGFGLQEIFANFVSGLILLFEKPIRIGDTVTINNLTGTVTKIEIRATTIVDWNRKEIIVPNKAFITDQLVNWSLSDAVTRLVINVGVAYGSDNALVTRLLLEAAEEVPQVLPSPKPEAYFVAFGASTLDYELRLFVNEMSHRLPVTHAVHQRIDAKFRQHQIDIAFPQLDLHIKRR